VSVDACRRVLHAPMMLVTSNSLPALAKAVLHTLPQPNLVHAQDDARSLPQPNLVRAQDDAHSLQRLYHCVDVRACREPCTTSVTMQLPDGVPNSLVVCSPRWYPWPHVFLVMSGAGTLLASDLLATVLIVFTANFVQQS
jgi:hypothetical protein